MKSKIILAYCTFPSKEVAETVAETLVREKIVACANLIPAITAIYEWQGQLMKESECAVVFKTQALKTEALKERVRAIHPYSVPSLVILPVTDGLPDFLKWVALQSL